MSKPRQYHRKRPVVVDAMQWNGDNTEDLADWCDAESVTDGSNRWLEVPAKGGTTRAAIDDWVIRSAIGNFRACSADIFNQLYRPARMTGAEAFAELGSLDGADCDPEAGIPS